MTERSRLHDLAFRGAGCDVPDRSHPGRLEPGHSWSVTCSRTIRGHDFGRLALAAHVTARTPDEAMIRDATAAQIQVIHPRLSLSVDASATSGRPGDTVTYTLVVTNTGDSVVRGIRVVQDRVGVVGLIGALAPGGTARLTSSAAVPGTPTTLSDSTTATGSDLSGFPDLRADDDELDRAPRPRRLAPRWRHGVHRVRRGAGRSRRGRPADPRWRCALGGLPRAASPSRALSRPACGRTCSRAPSSEPVRSVHARAPEGLATSGFGRPNGVLHTSGSV